MSLPMGHAMAGTIFYILARRLNPSANLSWKMLFFFIFLSGLPDLDLMPTWLFDAYSGYIHRTVMHSILFAMVVGLISAGIMNRFRPGQYKHLEWLFPATIFSHSVLDLLSLDLNYPQGVRMFWPLTDNFFYLPQPIMFGIRFYEYHGFWEWQSWIVATLREFVVMGCVLLIVLLCCKLWDRYSRLS